MTAAVAEIVDIAEARAVDRVGEIIRRAESRARERVIAYRGLLTPNEAWELLQANPSAKLLDVRSHEELTLIGRVPGAIEVEWKLYPEWSLNPRFLSDVKARVAPSDLVLLLCRSGVRSREAAEFLTREGFRNSFNVLEGFEGDKNAAGQRVVAGWKAHQLPWSQ